MLMEDIMTNINILLIDIYINGYYIYFKEDKNGGDNYE